MIAERGGHVDLSPMFSPITDLGAFIREQRTNAQISVRALATKAGVSNPYLSQVERGLRKPSADILAQIARGLSISVESLLARAGLLDSDIPAGGVELAIRADDVLTERQKSSLTDIYRALRAQTLADHATVGDIADPSKHVGASAGQHATRPVGTEPPTVSSIRTGRPSTTKGTVS